jgi:hypothetical protein
MLITRIKPPKFRVGRYILNEYELRQLQLEVAQGLKPFGIKVTSLQNNMSDVILPNGKFETGFGADSGYDIGSKIAIKHYKLIINQSY